MLPAAFTSVNDLTSFVGGLAAAIAVGAFIGQALETINPGSDLRRRRFIAIGDFTGFLVLIGLILFSAKWR